jgi:hypothetical protein
MGLEAEGVGARHQERVHRRWRNSDPAEIECQRSGSDLWLLHFKTNENVAVASSAAGKIAPAIRHEGGRRF